MFILTGSTIRPTGNEPFIPLPEPYDPKTGEPLPGVPFHHILVRPRIRKGEKDIISILKKMNNAEFQKFISKMSDEELIDMMNQMPDKEAAIFIRELLKRIKK